MTRTETMMKMMRINNKSRSHTRAGLERGEGGWGAFIAQDGSKIR